MNRPGVGPQSLRGLPNGFAGQQQLPQPKSTSSRIPNGKMVSNGTTWSFGGGPIGNAGLPNTRSNAGPMTSFAQTIGGSQTGTPLDLSEFPSLSNNQPQQASNSAQSTWSMQSMRGIGQATSQRLQQQSILPLQQSQAQQQTQQQQDDLFSSSSQLPNPQASFRFGNQAAVGQSSQSQSNITDEFPPLTRNINGEIGQDRTLGLLQNVGFSVQLGGSAFGSDIAGSQGVRNNGLLNALSGSSRVPSTAARVASPGAFGGLGSSRSSNEQSRQSTVDILDNEPNGFARSSHAGIPNIVGPHENALPSISQAPVPKQDSTSHSQLNSSQQQHSQATDFAVTEETSPVVDDPFAGMSDKDRFGLKGLLAIMKGPHADQAALISGMDVTALGFDLNSTEHLSEMIWSPWDENLARPDIPKFSLPECYQVFNVQPIENKLSNFSDETLMFMFYSNPQDIQQMIAAQELANRNWRYHKKLQLWLTKDDMMVPQPVNVGSERGYYIFFDPKTWSRERREFLLTYSDLETSTGSGPPGPIS